MSHQYKTIEDTVYMGFGSNDTSGSGDDGSTPVFDVRLAGDFASGIPVFSAAATLLTHANYPPGSHEVAIPATAGNGFLSSGTYLVYVSILVDSQNPTGFIGSFELNPVISNVTEINSVAQRSADLATVAQYLFANSLTLTDVIVDNSVMAQMLATSGLIANYSNVDDALQSIRDAITAANPQSHAATANNETTGTLDSGTYVDTETINNTYYQVSPAGAAVGGFGLNCDLTFNIGIGRVPLQVDITGYFDSGALRTVQVWAYNYILAAYVQVSNSTNDFGNTGSNQSFAYSLTQNMVQVSDGEMKIRFTSISTTIGDDWYCDYVSVTSIEQAGAGLTADAIQAAVWARAASGHDEDTLGYNLSKFFVLKADVVSATDAKQFIIDAGLAVNDAYNGMLVLVEDKTDDHYEVRRIIDYIGATNEVFVDRDFGFTPAAGDEVYFMSAGYGDVNTTHISGTAQTANDNGADINTILSVLGALADVAADGDPTNTDTVMQYMKQLINILIGTIGIVNFPAEGAPANNISLAEVIRAIYNDVTGLNGDVMRGTDGANTAVPDVAGTAAGLHGTTDGLIGGLKDFDPANDDVAVVTLTNTATAVTDRVTANTDQIAGIAASATKLAASAGTVVSAAAVTGTLSLTQMTTNLTEVTDDHYKGRIIIWTSGVLQNQATDITAYEGATKMLTFTGVTEAPSNNDTFVIV